MKKKILSIVLATVCVAALAACGAKQESAAPAEETTEAEAPAEETTDAEAPAEETTDAEAPAEETTEAEAPAEGTSQAAAIVEKIEEAATAVEAAAEAATAGETAAEAAADESAQIGNPWSEFDTAEAAGENAGIEPLMISDVEIELGAVEPYAYRSMESLVETVVEFPAVEMFIRKGKGFEDGDCSGDYNTYAHEWTQNIKGLVVNCYGNDEGRASKTIWQVDDYCYSIVVTGLGGDDNYGLNENSINELINGMQ